MKPALLAVLVSTCIAAACSKETPKGSATASATAAAASSAPSDPGGPCVRTKLETKMLKAACAEGGQVAAKRAMKEFMKTKVKPANPEAKCTLCHDKLEPEYPTKDEALAKFRELGGE